MRRSIIPVFVALQIAPAFGAAEHCGSPLSPYDGVLLKDETHDSKSSTQKYDIDISAAVRVPRAARDLQKLVENHAYWNQFLTLVQFAQSNELPTRYLAKVKLPLGTHKKVVMERVLKDSDQMYQLLRSKDDARACAQVLDEGAGQAVLRINLKTDLGLLGRTGKARIIENLRRELKTALEKIRQDAHGSVHVEAASAPKFGI